MNWLLHVGWAGDWVKTCCSCVSVGLQAHLDAHGFKTDIWSLQMFLYPAHFDVLASCAHVQLTVCVQRTRTCGSDFMGALDILHSHIGSHSNEAALDNLVSLECRVTSSLVWKQQAKITQFFSIKLMFGMWVVQVWDTSYFALSFALSMLVIRILHVTKTWI